jgi:hypothetical protein
LYENYFGQLKMLFTPTEEADYVFFLASDDHGELYLSTDEKAENKKKIAEEPSWSDPRLWVGDGTGSNTATRDPDASGLRYNRSDEYPNTEWTPGGNTIHLLANKSYYLEVLYKEGGGGDHGAVAVKKKSDPDPANGANELGGARVGWYIDPNTVAPIITTRPTTVKFAPNGTINFTVVAESAKPMTYQWYRNKRAIAGATSATYTKSNAGAADIGDYYVDVSNVNGTTSSYPDDSSRAIMTGALVIEVEDYNYDNGKTLPAASVSPLVSDLYVRKDGIPSVDIKQDNQSTADPLANGNSYRNGWSDGGTAVDFPTTATDELGNVDVIIDNGNGNTEKPDYTLTNNYKIGWGSGAIGTTTPGASRLGITMRSW